MTQAERQNASECEQEVAGDARLLLRERMKVFVSQAQQDAVRRDRTLVQRYPNEAAHQRARNAALDDASKAMRLSERRIEDLTKERKPLLDEAEFYKGKALPAKLKQLLDANDASIEAQQVLIENQKAELIRINKSFDAELARLKKLWGGAAPKLLQQIFVLLDKFVEQLCSSLQDKQAAVAGSCASG